MKMNVADLCKYEFFYLTLPQNFSLSWTNHHSNMNRKKQTLNRVPSVYVFLRFLAKSVLSQTNSKFTFFNTKIAMQDNLAKMLNTTINMKF